MENRLVLKSGGKSKKGLRRDKNQDSYLIDNILGIFIVADGLGGHSGGEIASQLITRTIHQFLQKSIIHSNGQLIDFQLVLNQAIKNAHSQILSLQSEFHTIGNMGSTVAIAVWNPPSTFYIANIGDSRVYLRDDNTIELLTKDHVERRKKLTQAIGIKIIESAHYINKTIKNKNRLLLCTNGLCEIFDNQMLSDLLVYKDDPNLICKNMVFKADEFGNPDDLTSIVVVIEYSSLSQEEHAKQLTIRQLVIESLEGKTLAFSKLYSQFEKPIMAFILSRCRYSKDEPIVQDVFQKCWIKIAEKLYTYNPEYPFLTFAFIWASYSVKELYVERDANNVDELSETDMTNELIFPVSDDYFECLKVLFSCHKLPHEILVFSFVKLLDYSIDDLIEKLSSIPLFMLLNRLKEEYQDESHISANQLNPYFNILEKKLKFTLNESLGNAPKKWYAEILKKVVGTTTLSEYYGNDPCHSISLWVNRVKEKCSKDL